MTEGYLIRRGQVLDGSGAPAVEADVRVKGQTISEIGPALASDGEEVVEASGLLVVPGLIDLHVHVFSGAGQWSIDPDRAGLSSGVTTVVDTGTSGALTYENFHRFVIAQAQEDVFALLNISIIGCLLGHPDIEPVMGELSEARYCHVASAVECIRRHPDRAIGMKVRLTDELADERPENEQAAFRGALDAAGQTGTFLMVHHNHSNVPTDQLLDALRPGDIFTHLYHPQRDSPFEAADHGPSDALLRAKDRGVAFDLGHGAGSFTWTTAEPACQKHGFWPDTISTDIHRFNANGPVHDMATTMTKMLYLGMPLPAVIRASTHRAAEAIRMGDQFGLLKHGRQADITLLRLEEGSFDLYDVRGMVRNARQRLVPVSVFKGGQKHACQARETVGPSPTTWSTPSDATR